MRCLAAAVAVVLALTAAAHADDPTVRIKPAKVVGPTSPELIARVLRRHQGRLRVCYEQVRGRDPKLRGTLRTTFVIQPDGDVTRIRVEGIDDALENCAARAARGFRFPREAAETRVQVAFVLRPPPAVPPPPPSSIVRGLGDGLCPCACACGNAPGQLCSPRIDGVIGDGLRAISPG